MIFPSQEEQEQARHRARLARDASYPANAKRMLQAEWIKAHMGQPHNYDKAAANYINLKYQEGLVAFRQRQAS